MASSIQLGIKKSTSRLHVLNADHSFPQLTTRSGVVAFKHERIHLSPDLHITQSHTILILKEGNKTCYAKQSTLK